MVVAIQLITMFICEIAADIPRKIFIAVPKKIHKENPTEKIETRIWIFWGFTWFFIGSWSPKPLLMLLLGDWLNSDDARF